MKLVITQENIDQGGHGACNCPIYREAVKIFHNCAVHQSRFLPNKYNRTETWPWPQEVRDWLVDYDDRKPVQPVTFEFEFVFPEKP